jgi:hypothetical protein
MTSATDPGYWVNHCDGFDIEWDGERVGVVEAVVLRRARRAEVLEVRGGLFGTSAYDVPVEDITNVPSRVRLVVKHAPRNFHPDTEGCPRDSGSSHPSGRARRRRKRLRSP